MKGLLVVLLALAPLAAGCGSDPASLEGSDDALRDASSSRIEFRLEGKNVPAWATMRSTGSIDYASSRGEMLLRGKSDTAPEAHLIRVGNDSYLGADIGSRTYWLKQSIDDASGTQRFIPGPGGISPDRLLKDLIDSSKKVDKLGSDEIRGVATTHYRAHLDKAKVGWGGITGDEPGAIDVWVDKQDLPRRIRVPYGAATDAPAAVADLFDFGVPVDVKAPPENEIVSEDKFDQIMTEECAGAEQAPEDMNPLCLLFGASGATLEGGETSPPETVPTTEGK